LEDEPKEHPREQKDDEFPWKEEVIPAEEEAKLSVEIVENKAGKNPRKEKEMEAKEGKDKKGQYKKGDKKEERKPTKGGKKEIEVVGPLFRKQPTSTKETPRGKNTSASPKKRQVSSPSKYQSPRKRKKLTKGEEDDDAFVAAAVFASTPK
jgi:hypothetical protein